jgi:hypothetical protein
MLEALNWRCNGKLEKLLIGEDGAVDWGFEPEMLLKCLIY